MVVTMTEIKRPVFFSGENPGMTLYVPGTEQVVAVVSYWHCTDSPWGVGHALILWLGTDTPLATDVGHGAIFTDNLELARVLVKNLTQHFPEFQDVPIETLAYIDAHCEHTYDATSYRVVCQPPNAQIELEWVEVLDRKQIIWPRFPAGETVYDLTTVICPCRAGHIQINGALTGGEVKLIQTADGLFSSTAFLAFAETWIGPLNEKGERGANS
jgi:hypothetical protein